VNSGDITLVKAFFPLQIEHFMNVRASDTKLRISPEYIENLVSVDETLKNTLECWKQTPKWMNLKALLKLVTAHKITKVVGVASGSMEFGPDDGYWTFRSAVQHSLMISVKEYIEEATNKKIKCYAQGPHYTTVDTWALAEHEPKVLLKIDDDCILFSCCSALPLKEITVEFFRPARLIWD
jgi:hypothetical protein